VNRTVPAFVALLMFLMPYGYFQAGMIVYSGATLAEPTCEDHAPYNTPASFTPHLWGTDMIDAAASNLTTNVTADAPGGLAIWSMPVWSNVTVHMDEEPIALQAWVVEQNPDEPWVLFVHGIRSCKANHEVLLPAGMLAEAGYNVVMMDMRDHWESTLEDGQVSAGQKEWRDVVAVWQWIQDEKGVPAERIGVMGASMGAGTVGIAFAQEPGMASVFLDSPFSNMGDIIVEELSFRGYPTFLKDAGIFAGRVSSGEDLVAHNPIDGAHLIGNRSMTIVHGEDDMRIRIHHGEALCDAAKAAATQPDQVTCWFESSQLTFDSTDDGTVVEGHVTLMLTHTPLYEQRLLEWAEGLRATAG
tara:strand:- start:1042 stop:2115 length:1074 start_codon:yes stop_codon:yes gene_type:complete